MSSPRRTNRISVLLLLLGFGSALAIYGLTPPEPPDDPLLNDPRAERKYHRELAMYGGKANVVSAEFIEWFDGLWHGRALAFTVAVLTVATTLGYRFVALHPGPVSNPTMPEKSP